ncbi:MAG: GNAT family N-acetyltransferase [Acidobacteria bacterium]|nr:GNAT family N-acetyltransferase [Acidobacteriota bacterium]
MRLRTMTMADIAAGLGLSKIAGWNQTAADWERFLRASPEGCFVAEFDGKVCGTVTTISYENRFAWVGMVLVDPQHRSKGIGTRLLEAAINYLDDQKIFTIKLDATPQGQPLYQKMGFVSEYEIERWTLRRTVTDLRRANNRVPHEMLTAPLSDSIVDTDHEAFGADRRFLLESLHQNAPEFTMEIRNNGILQGYSFGRRGLFADHLGPWFAKNASSAGDLLEAFLARSTREMLVVDCLKGNTAAVSLLRVHGFTYSRLLTRMYRGTNAYAGRPEFCCAILGPEFG